MRQIIKGRELVADAWHYAGIDEGEAAAGAPVALPLAQFLAAPGAARGVRLQPTDVDVAPLAPFLDAVSLVVIEFPSTGDGRGFSQANLLRERHGYRGELRAVGKGVRADQMFFLARCGFDSFELAPGEKLETAIAQLERFSVAYQTGQEGLVRPRRRFGG